MHEFSAVSGIIPCPSSIDGKYYTNYVIENIINEKFYYGAHGTFNLNDGYMGSSNILDSAITKYGEENFKKTYVWFGETSGEMFDLEGLVIDEDFVKRDDTYNIQAGGRYFKGHNPSIKGKGKGRKFTEEHKAKIREAHKKIDHSWLRGPKSEEHKKKIGDSNRGKIISEEAKYKNSETHKRMYAGKDIKLSDAHKKAISKGNLGRVHSEETRRKISETRKSKKYIISEETRMKISKSSSNRKTSDETRKKISKARQCYFKQIKILKSIIYYFFLLKIFENDFLILFI